MHPRWEIEREYAVRVIGELEAESMQALRTRRRMEDGPARFDDLIDEGGTGTNHWYRVKIREGRNREVRRMFEAVGTTVSRLIRVAYGAVSLPEVAPRGKKMDSRRRSPRLDAGLEGRPKKAGRRDPSAAPKRRRPKAQLRAEGACSPLPGRRPAKRRRPRPRKKRPGRPRPRSVRQRASAGTAAASPSRKARHERPPDAGPPPRCARSQEGRSGRPLSPGKDENTAPALAVGAVFP